MMKTYVKQIEEYYDTKTIHVQVETKDMYEAGWNYDEIEEGLYEKFDYSCSCERCLGRSGHWRGGISELVRIGEFTWKGVITLYRKV